MDLYLDTSTPTTILKLDDKTYEWHSDKSLAEDIFTFIHGKLQENHKDWSDIKKITYFKGPGSFTGLRIGAAVVNALADQLNIPLYDQNGELQKVILPDYGRPARITPPKK
jgi:tRNA threonylcarbamoyladenosine biosynthesis protein TsaB